MLLTPSRQASNALFAGDAVFVDGLSGSDTTGTRGRADRPFQSVEAANRASRWGDLIYVLFGVGYYSDPITVACMAGRFYYVDPGVILSSRLLNAPYVFLPAITGSSGNTMVSIDSYPFSSADVGREIVITWAGISDPQRYLIASASGSIAYLSDDAPGGGGSITGFGYLAPGPMQTDPFRNGQSEGLLQFQRFADASTLTLSGSNITATSAKLLADGATEFAPGQLTDGPTAHDPTWATTYAQTASSSPSGLYAALTGPNLNGRCTMVFTGQAPTGSLSAFDLCGENDGMGNSACYATVTMATATLHWGASATHAFAIASSTWFAAALSQADASDGYWFLNQGSTYSHGSAAGANSAAFSGNNYLIGGGTTLPSTYVGGYAFFDGPATAEKTYAMMNAFLNDLGLY